MTESKRPLKVFLCHASADKPKVRELYRYLRRRGIKPWFDEIDLIGGQDWQVEIPKAIVTSDAIIICLTKNSIDKEGYVQKEIKFALDKALEMPEGRIYLIPVRFEECEVPHSLSRYHWVDLFEESGFPRLMKSLRTRATQLERAIVEVPKPNEPKPDLSSTKPKIPENISKTTEDKKAILPDTVSPVSKKVEQELKPKPLQIATELEAVERKVQEKTPSLPLKVETEQQSVSVQSLSKRDIRIIVALVLLAIIVYSALIISPLLRNLSAELSVPTLTLTNNAAVIFTSAAQTAIVQLTQNAFAPTGIPSTAALNVTATSTCDSAEFIQDVTIPDGTAMSPGQVFTKTWKIRNSGSCYWAENYKALYSSGEKMSGKPQALSGVVGPGQEVEISVQFIAPTNQGKYRSTWQMANASGIPFKNAFYVEIVVK